MIAPDETLLATVKQHPGSTALELSVLLERPVEDVFLALGGLHRLGLAKSRKGRWHPGKAGRPPSHETDAARAAGKLTYNTGKPCKYGHMSERYVSGNKCVECNRLREDKRTKRERPRRRGKGFLLQDVWMR